MASYPTSTSPMHPGSRGLWTWLLRRSGLEAWFRQAPAATQAGREERVFLLLTLADAPLRPGDQHAPQLAVALAASAAALRASGGQVVSQQAGQALLSWPVAAGGQPAVRTYFQLRDAVRQLADAPALYGAASLGWVKPRWAGVGVRYRGAVLKSVAGILRESRRLGSDLLLTAALHHLDPGLPFPCVLHVAFDVAEHRYPATLYRVSAAPAA